MGNERRYLKLQCGDKFKCPRSDTLYSVEVYKDDPKWNKWAVDCTLKYDIQCPNDPKFYEVCGHSRAGCKADYSETMFCGTYICGYQDQVYTYFDDKITFGRNLLSGIVNNRCNLCLVFCLFRTFSPCLKIVCSELTVKVLFSERKTYKI